MEQLVDAARAELSEAGSYLLFDGKGQVLACSFQASPQELSPLAAAYADKDEAVKKGLVVQGVRYEVHRHHPPLIYGRTMGPQPPEASTGIAMCRVDNGPTGCAAYALITYPMPGISAYMVPMLTAFCEKNLGKVVSR